MTCIIPSISIQEFYCLIDLDTFWKQVVYFVFFDEKNTHLHSAISSTGENTTWVCNSIYIWVSQLKTATSQPLHWDYSLYTSRILCLLHMTGRTRMVLMEMAWVSEVMVTRELECFWNSVQSLLTHSPTTPPFWTLYAAYRRLTNGIPPSDSLGGPASHILVCISGSLPHNLGWC